MIRSSAILCYSSVKRFWHEAWENTKNQPIFGISKVSRLKVEDVRPSAGQSLPSEPVTLSIEEKLNVTLKRDGGIDNFDLQGMLPLQILNQEDGFIQVQVPQLLLLP